MIDENVILTLEKICKFKVNDNEKIYICKSLEEIINNCKLLDKLPKIHENSNNVIDKCNFGFHEDIVNDIENKNLFSNNTNIDNKNYFIVPKVFD